MRQQHEQHAQIAVREGLWDLEDRPRIAAGEDIFFWVTGGQGLTAHAVATENPRPLRPQDHRPWADDDTSTYRYRVPLRLVSDIVVEQVPWSVLKARSGLRGANQPPVNEVPDSGVQTIRELFAHVDISWPTDAVELGSLDIPTGLDDRSRVARAIAVRRGQKAFRSALLAAYGDACAVTGCSTVDVLEAAHISPYRGQHTNDVRNGLLLRADIHTLFDLYRLTVGADDLVVRVDPSLQGSDYAAFHGQPLRTSSSPSSAPDVGMLQQHNNQCTWLSEIAAG